MLSFMRSKLLKAHLTPLLQHAPLSSSVYLTDRGISDGDKQLLHLETRMMCRCDKCFGKHSHQKSPRPLDRSIKITNVSKVSDDYISVEWSDGHLGFIPRSFKGAYGTGSLPGILDKYLDVTQRRNSAQKFWTVPDADVLKSFDFKDVVRSHDAIREFLAHFMKNGLAFITNVPKDCNLLSVINNDLKFGPEYATAFGALSEVKFENNETNHAYHNGFLDGHIDLPYYTQVPSVFLFFCRKNTTVGGEGFYMDTFAAMNQIRSERPDLFEVLCTVDMYYQHHPAIPPKNDMPISMFGTNKVVEMRGEDLYRVIEHDPCQDEFAFANNVDIDTREKWLEAISYYRELMTDPSRAAVRYLSEGDLVLTDNHRVLHGRNAFAVDENSQRLMEVVYLHWTHLQSTLLSTLDDETFLELPNH